MNYRVLSYPNKSNLTPSFYIQIKGNHSGRPLRKPIINCVAVYTDIPYLFELVYLLFKGRMFEPFIIGSVVPFIRIDEIKQVIDEGLIFYKPEKIKLLDSVNKIDEVLNLYHCKIKLLQQAFEHLTAQRGWYKLCSIDPNTSRTIKKRYAEGRVSNDLIIKLLQSARYYHIPEKWKAPKTKKSDTI
jgi:hypothetical protein